MISNKPINLQGYVKSGTAAQQAGTSSGAIGTSGGEITQPAQPETQAQPEKQPEEVLVEEEKGGGIQTIQVPTQSGGKSAEEELIDLF